LTNWFPDHAILEPKQGGKMKFSFCKEKSQKDYTSRTADAFPEGTTKEFIPNKKLSYTWQHKDVSEFP
jgi:Activator of Hsp90 ATPase homolog 1-like protein